MMLSTRGSRLINYACGGCGKHWAEAIDYVSTATRPPEQPAPCWPYAVTLMHNGRRMVTDGKRVIILSLILNSKNQAPDRMRSRISSHSFADFDFKEKANK
jgi:hypothetical protein